MKKRLMLLIVLFSVVMSGAAIAVIILPDEPTVEPEPCGGQLRHPPLIFSASPV